MNLNHSVTHLSSGTSVGGVLYSTLQSELIQQLGLDGCLLVIGALALNVAACGGLMRPLTLSGFYLKQRAAIARRQLQEEASNQKPAPTDPVITMETKDQLVKRRRSVFRCSAFVKMIKMKMRRYSR